MRAKVTAPAHWTLIYQNVVWLDDYKSTLDEVDNFAPEHTFSTPWTPI